MATPPIVQTQAGFQPKMRIFTDEQILDETFRKKIIDEINGQENRDRKLLAARRYEILRDEIKPHVLQLLSTQGFNGETMKIMEARCTSVNIYKKVVSKKARSYTQKH